MTWSDGYVVDVEYPARFFGQQDPGRLSSACVLNGFEPVDVDQPFTYFELGCGQGFTAAVLAAAHPHGSFIAADSMPAHVAAARQLAAEAKLDNLRLLESSFAELAAGKVDVPPLDFIAMHGVYSWVAPEKRRHIVDFMARYLKPGGIVYVSYNAMPGWSPALPVQRLLVEHGQLDSSRGDIRMERARGFLDRMVDAGAEYFTSAQGVPAIESRLRTLKSKRTAYLAHEYLNRHWEALYHADVARDFGLAKLDFAGGACLSHAFLRSSLSRACKNLLDEIADPAWRETVADYMLNTVLRADVFVRGARRMPASRRAQWLQRIGLALLVARPAVRLAPPGGQPMAGDTVFAPALDALAQGPRSLAELAALIGNDTDKSIDLAAILSTCGEGAPYVLPAGATPPGARASRLNRVVAQHAMLEDRYHALASPVLRTGVETTQIERLVFHHLQEQPECRDAALIARWMRDVLAAQRSPGGRIANLRDTVAGILEWKLPVWRQLGILQETT